MESFVKRAQGLGVTWSEGPVFGRPGGMTIGNMGRANSHLFAGRGGQDSGGPNLAAGMGAMTGMFKDLKNLPKANTAAKPPVGRPAPTQPPSPPQAAPPSPPPQNNRPAPGIGNAIGQGLASTQAAGAMAKPLITRIPGVAGLAARFPGAAGVAGKVFGGAGAGAVTAAQGLGEINDLAGSASPLSWLGLNKHLGVDDSAGYTVPREEFLQSVNPAEAGILGAGSTAASNPVRGIQEIGRGALESGFGVPYEMMRARGMVPAGVPAEQALKELPSQYADSMIAPYREMFRGRKLDQQLQARNRAPQPNLPLPATGPGGYTGEAATHGRGNLMPFLQ